MSPTALPAALFTQDDSVRMDVRQALSNGRHGLTLAFDMAAPFAAIPTDRLADLRRIDPQVVFLDIDSEPGIGIKFAQFLSDLNPARKIVGIGTQLSTQQLMAAMKAGISEFLVKPVTREALDDSIGNITRKLTWNTGTQPAATREPAKLFAFFSPKGGSGATTVATNIAVQLYRLTGRKTLLVDLDVELGEVAILLGVEPRFNFIDLVHNYHRMDENLLASFIERHESGVHVLSAPYHPERAATLTGGDLAKILRFLKDHYDYVIVDSSKSFSAPTLATFAQADAIYLVATMDLPALRNIKRAMPLISRAVESVDDKIRLIINRFTVDSEIKPEEVEQTLGIPIFWTIANDYAAIMRSINSGEAIVLDSTSQAAADIREMGAELAGLRGPHDRRKRPRGNTLMDTLGRFRRRMWRANETPTPPSS